MADSAPAKKGFGLLKPILGGMFGLIAGVFGVYATAIVDKVAKPTKPVANFAVSVDGFTVNCQNHASGESGWWDFGDGSPLEPFDSNKTMVSHAYAKTGNYSVKLTVRNFLNEENERSVPVELAKTAAVTAANTPSILSFSVEPIGSASTAPATFRVRGEVKNADRVIWDMGGDKLEVTDSPGTFEKLVVFERPGTFPIQLIGQSDKTAVKQSAQVTIAAPRSGAMSVMVRTTETGSRVERVNLTESVALPVPQKGARTTIEKVIQARPGHTIADAKLINNHANQVKNLKVDIASDRRSMKLTGEWANSGDSATKTAGGSDLLVTMQVTADKSTSVTLGGNSMAMPLVAQGGMVFADPTNASLLATIPMPVVPPGVTNLVRKIEFELREVGGDGKTMIIGAMPDMKLPMRASVKSISGITYVVEVEQLPSGQMRVVLRPANMKA